MSRRATICLAVAVLAMAGCGGGSTLSKKELETQAGSVESFAAEGALVAQSVQEGRTTDAFVRVHTEYMAKAVRKVQTQLASAHASGSLEQKRQGASRLALLVALNLDRLHRDPGDKAIATQLRRELDDNAAAAQELAK